MTQQIDLWSIDLVQSATHVQLLQEQLSDDELSRAQQFASNDVRHRWIVGRGMLRTILSKYVDTSPAAVEIKSGDHGKPYIPHQKRTQSIEFNLAHSHELALLAVTDIGPVGVDVEWIKEINDLDGVVNRFFSRTEQNVFGELPGEQRLAGFYACWTRKEAYLKALGCGLSRPTDSFEVEFSPGRKASIVEVDGSVQAAARWSLFNLAPRAGYAGAVAVEAQGPIELEWHDIELTDCIGGLKCQTGVNQ